MHDENKEGQEPNIEDTAQHPPVRVSPDELLAESAIAAPRVPGAENAESDIKKEFNPNSE
ncbi:MAG: hypothetical protein LC800_15615 [Acidobacteria bacterium]|nr:hypothetical protein [Acidobacteriota bacterium]